VVEIWNELAGWASQWPLEVAALAFVLLYALMTALPLPGTRILALGAGAFFSTPLALGLVVVGACLGASLGFWVARHFLQSWLRSKFQEKQAHILHTIDKNSALFLLSLRLNPAVSFSLIHYLAAISTLRFKTFLGITAFVSLLYSVFYVVFGRTLGAVATNGTGVDVFSPWLLVWLLASLTPLFWVQRVTQKALTRRKHSDETHSC
jgi:uncharacterized membrane protein YdjX (TVP38/TMEM64 family)